MVASSPIADIVRGEVSLRAGRRSAAVELVDEVARRVWTVREPLGVSAWATRYRVLPPKVSDAPGLVDLDKTPYLRGFMDAASNPLIKRITVMKASQLGFTMALDTIVLWAVDQRPTPTLWICPNAELSKEAAKYRIEPGARACPATQGRIGESKDDATTKVMDFDLMRVSFVGSGNANNLRSRPAGLVIIDDFERCEDYTLREAEQRVAAFEESKIIIVSPPSFEGVGTDLQYSLSNRSFYAVPCWSCGFEHEWVWENLRWEGGLEADPDVVEKTARMICPNCRKDIENHHKPAAMRAGMWKAEAPHVVTHAGFREGAFYSPWQNFGWVARGFLDAKGKPDRVWRNGVLGLPEKAPAAIDLKDLEELAKGSKLVPGLETWTRRSVPDDVCTLIASVDIQADYVYVLITGWSAYGLRAYYIDHFVRPMPSNTALEQVYQAVRERRYQRMDGRWQKVVMQAWDTGHRATDTHAVWLRHSPDKSHAFMLVKGMGSINMTKLWYYARPEDMGEGTKARAAGVKLLQLNSHQWKNRVAHAIRAALATIRQLGRPRDESETEKTGEEKQQAMETMQMASLAVAAGDDERRVGVILGKTEAAGEGVMAAMFLPPDVPKDFLEHLCSEHIKEGRWVETKEHVRNEGWDTTYYAAAAGDAAGLRDIGEQSRGKWFVTRPTDEQMRAWGLRDRPTENGKNPKSDGGTNGNSASKYEERANSGKSAEKRRDLGKQGHGEVLNPAGQRAKTRPTLAEIRARLADRMKRR